MDKFKNFLGIDVSKEYFDAVLIVNNDNKNTLHCQFVNDTKGVKERLTLILWGLGKKFF
jgi:transposase